jgi:hypothetical protein
VFRSRTPRRFTAWLALLAMTLIAVMPVISRTMPGSALAGMNTACVEHMAAAKHPPSPHAPGLPLDRCGYCFLLDKAPIVIAKEMLEVPPLSLPPTLPATVNVDGDRARLIFNAEPRGPPQPSPFRLS